MRSLAVVALGVVLAAPARSGTAVGQTASGAQTLLERIVRRHADYRDFQARFVETPISRASGKGTSEAGLVSFRRPEQWRWEYQVPERKVVLVRGKTATIAIEGEAEVERYDLGEIGNESSIGSLLSGRDALVRSFSATYDPSGTSAEPVLRLEPLQLSDEYDHVLVRVRAKDFTLREVVVVDPGGNRLQFQFEGFKTNLGLPESLFIAPSRPPRPR